MLRHGSTMNNLAGDERKWAGLQVYCRGDERIADRCIESGDLEMCEEG